MYFLCSELELALRGWLLQLQTLSLLDSSSVDFVIIERRMQQMQQMQKMPELHA